MPTIRILGPLLLVLLVTGCDGPTPDPIAEVPPRSGGLPSAQPLAPAATVGGSEGSAVQSPAALGLEGLRTEALGSSEEWTVGIVDGGSEVAGVATLAEVRSGENDGFDRFVIEFEGDAIPSYHLEYIDRPVRQCGSGNVMEIAGDGWLSVRMEPARAHNDQGRPTIAERQSSPGLPTLLETRLICDFEANVEWILGVSSPNRYRVMELSEPTRLVVDLLH